MEKKRQTLSSGERLHTDESKGVSKARRKEKTTNKVFKKKDIGKTEDLAEISYNRALKVLYVAAVCLSRPSCVCITANAITHGKQRFHMKVREKTWGSGSEGRVSLSNSAQWGTFASSPAAEKQIHSSLLHLRSPIASALPHAMLTHVPQYRSLVSDRFYR